VRLRFLGAIPYFLAGVAVGVFVDRILGGPGGNSGLVAVVSAVAAAFALSGPLLQERMREGAEEQRELKAERRDHAIQIADSTLRWLGSVAYSGKIGWASTPGSALSPLEVNLGEGASRTPVETLAYWRYAVEHFAGDPEVGPVWTDLEKMLGERAALKSELDNLSAQKLREALTVSFGTGFVPGPVWDESAPARCYWEPGLLDRLRYPFDTRSLQTQETNFSPGPETPGGKRFTVLYGGSVQLASTSEPGLLDLEKFRTMCSGLRQDSELRPRLAKLEELDGALTESTREFARVAWSFYERVSGSKQIPGSCGLCPKPED
jgi:hypothetical protein